MKKLVLLILFSVCLYPAFANHIKGGFFTYEYMSRDTLAKTTRYHVTLTVYMDCASENNTGQVTDSINFTFFNSATNAMYRNVSTKIISKYMLNRTVDEPCIAGNQTGCFYYIVVYNLPFIDLPDNVAGYTVSYQRCCRIIDIQNMPSSPSSSSVGNTYSVHIPGINTPKNGHENSSANFLVNDIAVVCGGNYFEASFDANDPDGDQLSYSFCDAWTGGGNSNAPGNGPNTPVPDPAVAPLTSNPVTYPVLTYAPGFNGSAPLGPKVTIDQNTGKISGIAPASPGEYVVTVCVTEIRQGVAIATTRKELHLKVGQCSPIKATLDPTYISCDGYTVQFANQTNSGVLSYFWDFGVPNQANGTSTAAAPTFTYADTGTYNVKLVVNRGSVCPDSTITSAKVYPGFFPGFTNLGVCINKPTRFFDSTQTTFGTVNAWSWNFGDASVTSDTSHLQNPQYVFTQMGPKTIQFIVQSNKGCIDTVIKTVDIVDKPPLKVLPKDTLICNGDNVQLQAIGGGVFSWSPTSNITNGNTATPTVNPKTTTNYVVLLDDNGCLNRDSVRVRVVDFVTLRARTDTVICATDSVQLFAATDGLKFQWTGPGIADPTRANTMALPTGPSSTYQLKSIIGSCSSDDDFTASLVPYPVANAGPNVEICFDTKTQLKAQIVASSFAWTPTASLTNANTLNPIAYPKGTTTYVLTVYDTIGCPKPFRDSILVTVRPKMQPYAGRDTAVVVNQPLEFQATGGTQFAWSPGTSLNKTNVADPIGIYSGSFDSIIYKVVITDEAGCKDSARVTVRVFRTTAQVFVPTAFTPNGDGHNDFFRPIPVGISRFDYFRVYNRWGELVYSSVSGESGWDGRLKGKDQASGTYVWMLKGEDFGGRPVMEKGHVTLIR